MKQIVLSITLTLFAMSTSIAQTDNISPVESGYAPVNGLKMYYEIHGEGKPLLLLHGSFMTIDMNFGELIPELAKNNKVIAIAMQGHGRTSGSDKAFSYENFAKDVNALLEYLKIENTNILGYSLGATVGLKFAIDHPKKVNRIVFISSTFSHEGWLPSVRENIANLKPEFLTQTPLKTAYDKIAPDPSNWNNFITKMIEFENKPYDLGIEKIKSLKSPILIINGDYDGVDVSHSMKLFKALGGGGAGIMEPLSASRFAVIPGTTHVTLMMQTEQLLNYINTFLNQTK